LVLTWLGRCDLTLSVAYEQEHATPLYFCHGVFIDRFIFKSNLFWMRLPWECLNQSQDSNWRHCVTGPELPLLHKRKGVLKIDQSVKMPYGSCKLLLIGSWRCQRWRHSLSQLISTVPSDQRPFQFMLRKITFSCNIAIQMEQETSLCFYYSIRRIPHSITRRRVIL